VTSTEGVVDSLLPGDDVLPSGTAAGVRIDTEAHRTVLDAIARAGADADALRHVEREMPAEFAALLFALVEDYYDSDAVIAALGWTRDAPQPSGHPLPAFDERLLERVRRRAPLWRDTR
jgi:hypothetical protein